MYVHRIEFSIPADQDAETTADFAKSLLGALRMNGQLCGKEWPLFVENRQCVALVLAPEQGSLAPALHGEYVRKVVHQGDMRGISITFTPVAEDCTSAQTCTCHTSSGYVLFTTYLSLESPIRCLDCFLPVPLYRFPVMPSGEYYELICWQSDYQSCDRLQMNCTTLERATTRQLSNKQSSLSKQGIEICRTMENLTRTPFYYYLYRAHARSLKSEQERCCPSCGQSWHLETPLHSLFHFQCEPCRLVSNFGWNLCP
ncbi:DUF2310 family Zn-ribbon-containing protein [Chitinilyticum litopenaei]|uniref:DUF2310 family Zn-ribbon-containing protein n=1 Tax=Chitinilyticum litopenaei TaxID=1121276 RepID=UPI00130DD890|nr:DUF2310 family Zn-ribbon-containing protein [Chitinilyticum litopenaei]